MKRRDFSGGKIHGLKQNYATVAGSFLTLIFNSASPVYQTYSHHQSRCSSSPRRA